MLGGVFLTVGLAALAVASFVPTPYVIESPGPAFNTLGLSEPVGGKHEKNAPELIEVENAKTYPTAGSLDMLTVSVTLKDDRPNWLGVIAAWLTPSESVVPMESVYPEGVTQKSTDASNAAMMTDSQQAATAAALQKLGYDVPRHVIVGQIASGYPADGVLAAGDRITAVNGAEVTTAEQVQKATAATPTGEKVEFTIERDGSSRDVQVGTKQVADRRVVGIALAYQYDLPVKVKIQLKDVGGPSAGMMFALGIMDKLTPGHLNHGKRVAGTGTITAEGDVGAIGGIRQKMYAARDAGAKYFLAPADNCAEVTGHIPDGLRVFKVAKLDDAVTVLDDLDDNGKLNALPTCRASQ